MSTRMSIFYGTIGGTEYHLYRDGFDTDGVHLQLDADEPLRIPNEVWEVIRRFQAVDVSLADETDEHIRERATKEIEERMADIVQARRETGRDHVFQEARGMFVYGSADDPIDDQIERTIAEIARRREAARRVKGALTVA